MEVLKLLIIRVPSSDTDSYFILTILFRASQWLTRYMKVGGTKQIRNVDERSSVYFKGNGYWVNKRICKKLLQYLINFRQNITDRRNRFISQP